MIKNKNNVKIGLRFLKNTDQTASAYMGMDGTLRDKLINHWSQGVHVYLLSDEEAKLGEWVFDNEFFLNSKMEEDWDSILVYKTDEEYYRIGKDERKIVATTDPDILNNTTKVRKIGREELKELIDQFNN